MDMIQVVEDYEMSNLHHDRGYTNFRAIKRVGEGRVEGISNLVHCRDALCGMLSASKLNIEFDGMYGYEMYEGESLPYKDETLIQMIVKEWGITDFRNSVKLLNKVERAAGLKRTKIMETNYANVFVISASAEWSYCNQLYSLFLLIIRTFSYVAIGECCTLDEYLQKVLNERLRDRQPDAKDYEQVVEERLDVVRLIRNRKIIFTDPLTGISDEEYLKALEKIREFPYERLLLSDVRTIYGSGDEYIKKFSSNIEMTFDSIARNGILQLIKLARDNKNEINCVRKYLEFKREIVT